MHMFKCRWWRKSVWSDYHFDMNVQVAAWPLWAANHDEEFISLLRLLEENLQSIREAVPPEYQDDCGAMICEYIILWLVYCRGGWDFASDKYTYTGNNGYFYPPGSQLGNLAWTCQILWVHYRYTMNTTMLTTLLAPLLRMSNNYYTRWFPRELTHFKIGDQSEWDVSSSCRSESWIWR